VDQPVSGEQVGREGQRASEYSCPQQ